MSLQSPIVLGIKKTFAWVSRGVVAAVVLSTIYYGAAVDQTPIGPTFNLLLLRSTIAGSATVALIILFFLSRTTTQKTKREVPLRNYVYLAVTLLVLAAFAAAFVVIWSGVRDSKTKEKAAAAQREFKIEHQGAGFERSQVDQTLAELQEAYETLSGELPEPIGESQITIQTYRDLSEYRTDIGIERSLGAVRCTLNGPIIYIPLEESNILTEDEGSRTPKHEMVHAVMCQALGMEKMRSIPSWFHEGMAQIYENDGPYKFPDRVLNRTLVWFFQSKLAPRENFCTGSNWNSGFESTLFYGTSLEFVRAMESKHGRDKLVTVIREVQHGTSFPMSLRRQLGDSCYSLYSRWLESWRIFD